MKCHNHKAQANNKFGSACSRANRNVEGNLFISPSSLIMTKNINMKSNNHEAQPCQGTRRRRDEEQIMTKQTLHMKHFSAILYKGDNFCDFLFAFLYMPPPPPPHTHTTTTPFEKESTLKGKNLFLLE